MDGEWRDAAASETTLGDAPLNGWWERGGRSLNSAAVAGLLGVGVIYFYGQSIVVTIVMFASAGRALAADGTDGFFRHLLSVAEATKTPVRVSLMVTQFLLMLLPTLWLVRRWHSSTVRKYIRLRPCSPAQAVLSGAAMVFLFPANMLVSDYLVSKLNIPEEMIRVNQSLFTASTVGEFVVVVLAIAVTPAICEEILFRGYAQRTFERTIGWKSVILVGVLFGLYHMQPLGLLSLSALGLVFGYFYFMSKSLIPGMIAHFTTNFLAVLWLYLSGANGLSSLQGASRVLPVTALVALPFAGLALYQFHSVSIGRPDGVT